MRRRVELAKLLALALALPLGGSGCGLWPTLDVECMESGRCLTDAVATDVQVFGQPDEHTNLQLRRGLSHPTHAIRMGTTLIIADEKNHRVVLLDDPVSRADSNKDIVLGQPDFATNRPNHGGRSAQSLNAPHSLATDGVRLFVADSGNNRVLVWETKPKTPHQPADYVLGQPDMMTSRVGVSDRDFNGVPDISIGPDGQLLVTDQRSNRVLIFDSAVTKNHPSAVAVIGQVDMTTNNKNGMAPYTPTDKGLLYPRGATLALGKRMGVVDAANHRVLFWNNVPSSNYEPAVRVLGQTTMTAGDANGGLPGPTGAVFDTPYAGAGTQFGSVAISDGNHRVLLWTSVPTTDGVAANFVYGQPDLTSYEVNNGGVTAQSLSTVEGLSYDGSNLYVADSDNHRVLMFAGLPMAHQPTANRVIGQPTFTVAEANNAAEVSAQVYNRPLSVSSGGNRLAIVDSKNHRVLLWHQRPTQSGTPPDLALGQPDFVSSSSNHGDAMLSGNGFIEPAAVWTDGTHLAVADLNRVLIWNSWPTSSLQPADIVLGQADMQSNQPNAGASVSARTLWRPSGISSNGRQFAVSDAYNHRVLLWQNLPTNTQEPAAAVVGQSQLDTNSSNAGATLCTASRDSADSGILACPESVVLDETKLYVADRGHARVVIWNHIPQGRGEAGSIVLGHPTFKGGAAAAMPSADAFMSVSGITVRKGRLYVSDPTANRILYWNAPTQNGQSADGVIGQSSFIESYRHDAGLDAHRLAGPLGLDVTAGRLYVCDALQHRVLAFPHP